MSGPFLGKFQNPVYDINSPLDYVTSDFNYIDNYAQQLFGSLTGVRQSNQLFVVGFIPPDIKTDFVAFEQQNRVLSTIFGDDKSKTSSKQGENKANRNEFKSKNTSSTSVQVGVSIYNSLRAKNYSQEDAERLTPILYGHVATESGSKNGVVTNKNYNLANITTGTPGTFKNPSGKNTGNNYSTAPVPPSGGTYILGEKIINGEKRPVYFLATDNLQDSTDKYVSVISQWGVGPGTTDPASFVHALRPDVYGQIGVNESPFFEGDNAVISQYEQNVGKNSDALRLELGLSGKSLGTLAGEESAAKSVGINVMTNSSVTDEEGDDPINFTGRNVRVLNDSRQDLAQKQVEYIKQQILNVQSVPPLAFVIGPNEFTRSYEPTVDAPKARRGHVVHMWLEKPVSISAKGTTSAQYIFDAQGNGGLTSLNRTHSLSYKNLMSLIRLYKNGGYVYSGYGAFGEKNDGIPLFALSLYIYHDGKMYIGSFDDFSVSDSADKPHNLEYSFKFTVRYEIEAMDASAGGNF